MSIEIISEGGLNNLPFILRQKDIKKIFLVTGKKSYHLSGAKNAIDNLLRDFECCYFTEYSENPKLEEALNGIKIALSFGAQAIVAVGGGSALDTAKVIKAFLYADNSDDGEHLASNPLETVSDVPFIAIPTTSGTGSEATHFAVAYFKEKKYSFAHQALLPDIVILDPTLTYTQTRYITACTGFDAICQAIESLWARSSNELSRVYARSALQILVKNISVAVNKPNAEIRKSMQIGANLAGKAINISKTTAPHAASYSITSLYGIPHGHAVALTLHKFAKYLQIKSQDQGLIHINNLLNEIYTLFNVSNINQFYSFWQKLMRECGLENKLEKIADAQGVKAISSTINVERLGNFPLSLTRDDIVNIILE